MKRTAIAAAAAALLALAACTTPTPYQPLQSGAQVEGGYTDQILDQNHFRVSFAGNSVTSREQVEMYMLYRAAEVTTQRGYEWFEMMDHHTHNNGTTFIDGGFGPYGYGYWAPVWGFHGPGGWAYGGWGWGWGGPWGPDYAEVDRIDRYTATADVAMGNGPKPPRAYDARQVIANLGNRIVRPGQPGTER